MGTVYLVGAGPWDEGLLTLRGAALLARAGAVLYDALANPALLRHAPAGAERTFVGRRGGRAGPPLEEVCELLVAAAARHEVVVRLKGGDPFLFGRGGEEALALHAAGVPFEVVPGVSSAVAAAAYAGVPLTHRGLASSVVYATGRTGDEGDAPDFEALGRLGGTLVLFMGITGFGPIAAALLRGGRAPETPVAFVRWGTRADQETVIARLGDWAGAAAGAPAPLRPPAIAIVGEVVALHAQLDWFAARPLSGRRVVITRAELAAATPDPLEQILRDAGADIVPFPTIETLPPDSWEPCDRALAALESYDWVLFTSPRAVAALLDRLDARGRDLRAFGRARLAAVGDATADALRARGLRADAVPSDARAEGLLAALGDQVRGARVFLPRAAQGRDVLPDGLRAAGAAAVDVAPVYRTVPAHGDAAPVRAALGAGTIDAVTFTSGSTVGAFCDLIDAAPGGAPGLAVRLCAGTRVAVIGAVTRRAAEERGLRVDVQPPHASIPALAHALVAALAAAARPGLKGPP